ncbi:hypothetical protein ALP94_04868 [Pseudomonas savastanoi pv. glycinea]|nr:hypothetical protein ALP94_04868 [Pseudomonas savastanoi pv. glycinea]
MSRSLHALAVELVATVRVHLKIDDLSIESGKPLKSETQPPL